MESSLTFYRYGAGQLTQPFSQLEIHSYTDDSSGVVIHKEDVQLIDDWNIHVYYNQPLATGANRQYDSSTGDSASREVIQFEDARPVGRTRPPVLYVREGGSFGEMAELTEFMERHFYSPKQEAEEWYEEEHLEDPYQCFVSEIDQHSSGSLEQYLKGMLSSMGLESKAHLVLAYLNIFHVGFVDEDTNPNPLSNYELLEFVGDLAAWKPLNDIFIEYAERHNIELTEPVITSMHRTYASKEKQAQIAKQLHLSVFLKKKGEVTIDTYEDLFESFVGSMFLTNFHIRALLSVDLRLHEVFLRWVYSSWDLSGYVEKPEITEFYEQMRVLVGVSAFKERLISSAGGSSSGLWVMRGERGVMEKIAEKLAHYKLGGESSAEDSSKKIADFVTRLGRMIGKPYKNDEEVYESRRQKYHEITTFVKQFIKPTMLRQMTNDRNTADWSEDTKTEFERLMRVVMPEGYTVNERFTDKSRTASYWIVKDNEGELVYSTMSYDQGEDPDMLVSLIRDQMEGKHTSPDQSVRRVPYDPAIHAHFFLETPSSTRSSRRGMMRHDSAARTEVGPAVKWFLVGTPSAIESYVSEAYDEERGKFFLVITSEIPARLLNDSQVERLLEYDPRPRLYVKESINWNYLRGLFVSVEEPERTYKPELPDTIHRYIGDRAAYGYTALIAVLNHQITNVHHLTAVRNFYRSKELKREITRLLDIRDEQGELISFDQLVGMNLPMAEQIITYLYMHVVIEFSVIHTAKKRLEVLRAAIFQKQDSDTKHALKDSRSQRTVVSQPEAMRKRMQTQRTMKAKVLTVGSAYVYETSKGERLSVQVSGFDYAKVREAFDEYVLSHEQRLYPQMNAIRNARFSSMSGYDTLKQVMEFRNVQEWQLGWNWKNSVKRGIVLRYYSPSGLTYVNGSDIESVVKQL